MYNFYTQKIRNSQTLLPFDKAPDMPKIQNHLAQKMAELGYPHEHDRTGFASVENETPSSTMEDGLLKLHLFTPEKVGDEQYVLILANYINLFYIHWSHGNYNINQSINKALYSKWTSN